VTQLGPPEGMRYVSIARVASNSGVTISCSNTTNIFVITSHGGAKSVSIVVGAERNYDAKKRTAEHGYSLKGEDPAPAVEAKTKRAAAKTLAELRDAHVKDFALLIGRFELDLPDSLDLAKAPTAEIIARYSASMRRVTPISRVYCSITPIIFPSRVRGPARFRQTCKDGGARM
jgi:alpha-L-fucosidase 2